MIITFFGHRDAPPTIESKLDKTIRYLIENKNARHFYVGNQGNFDTIALKVLRRIKQDYEAVTYEVVLAYLPDNKRNGMFLQDPTLFPESLEFIPKRYAIDKRNRWMIEYSDAIISYVISGYGGAAKYKNLAVRRGKMIYELSE